METTTFLGAALGFIALMLVLFLYINRKWCFATPGSFICCDENTLPAKTVHTIRKYHHQEEKRKQQCVSTSFLLIITQTTIILINDRRKQIEKAIRLGVARDPLIRHWRTLVGTFIDTITSKRSKPAPTD